MFTVCAWNVINLKGGIQEENQLKEKKAG